jgi:deoxyadenosine/deoxycytidine kinase
MHTSSESCYYFATTSSEAPSIETTANVPKKQMRVCIEGNIGAGKTTLIGRLSKLILELPFVDEFHVELEQIDMNMLALFNQDPIKHGLAFQNSMMRMRLAMMQRSLEHIERARNANRSCIVLIDTGPLRELAFTRANELSGNIDSATAQAHVNGYVQILNAATNLMPEKIVLLNPPVAQCAKNIRNRNRDHEDNIAADYLNNIRRAHVSEMQTIAHHWPQTGVYTVELQGEHAEPHIVWNLINTM